MVNGGFGLVLDGSESAAGRARSMLGWDVSNGVARFLSISSNITNSISNIANSISNIATISTLITIALWQTCLEWEQQRSGNNRQSDGRSTPP